MADPRSLLLVASALAISACASTDGNFQLAEPPPRGWAQVYVFRTADGGNTRDQGELISLDGAELGLLRAPMGLTTMGCEYLWRNVEPGPHRIGSRYNTRWWNLGSVPADPIEQTFVAEAGRLHFFRVNRAAEASFGFGMGVSSSGGFESFVSPVEVEEFKEVSKIEDQIPEEIRKCQPPED